MKRILGLVGCMLLLTSQVYAFEVSVVPEFWAPDLYTNARIEKDNVGQEVDFVRDLGMDDENALGVTVDLGVGDNSHIILGYWSVGYDGNEIVKQDIVFNGITYSANTRVRSAFDLDVFELGYIFDLINFETFQLGFMLNLDYYAIDTQLDAQPFVLTQSSDDKIDLLFPLFGIRFGIGFWENRIELAGEFAGLWWQGSGWWDSSAQLSFYFTENLALTAGYHAVHFDVSDDDDSANVKLSGPTLAVTGRF